jgi:glutathione S-transferase
MTSPSIELYGAQTGNCLRAAIALEEAMVPHTVRHVDLRSGEHRRAAYLALNPAGQVPTMVDRSDEASPFVLSQSNAIIFYAAARAPGRLLPEHEGQERAIAYERFFFFVTDVIAPSHAAFILRRQNAVEAPGLLDDGRRQFLVSRHSRLYHRLVRKGASAVGPTSQPRSVVSHGGRKTGRRSWPSGVQQSTNLSGDRPGRPQGSRTRRLRAR